MIRSGPSGRKAREIAVAAAPVDSSAPHGRVLEHTFDAARDTLLLRYQARGRVPLELFVPARRYPSGFVVRCDGRAVRATPRRASNAVMVRCPGGSGVRVIELVPAS